MWFSYLDYLNSFDNWEARLHQARGADFDLINMERLLHAFGRPDDKLKFAHIAGSKGKGSTCVFLASILRAAGYRVGLYTSPHLYDVRERIRILEPLRGESPVSADPFEGMPTEEELAERMRYYKGPVDSLRFDEKVPVTYFEYLTALAVSWFASKKVDIVVLETGLGGRLDATNVFETMSCGITSIGYEHTHILGETLGEIAGEKAGIIKSPTQRVVVAPQEDGAASAILKRCAEFGIRPTIVGQDLSLSVVKESLEGTDFEVRGRREYKGLHTGLTGQHQAINAAMAIGMAEDLEIFGFVLSEKDVAAGIRGAVWPARFEVVRREPHVILDAAHTGESAAVLARTFANLFSDRRAVIVFGASADKDIKAMAQALTTIADRVILTKANHPRACELGLYKTDELFGVPTEMMPTLREALDRAFVLAGPSGIVLVTGSIFVAAEARALLGK